MARPRGRSPEPAKRDFLSGIPRFFGRCAMAHNIDLSTGEAAVFVTGEPPWHRLGKVIDQAATSAEAIGFAGLDWTVEKWPMQALYIEGETEKTVPVPATFATVRTDTQRVLGIVSAGYRVFQ